jgi:hypothetical protein
MMLAEAFIASPFGLLSSACKLFLSSGHPIGCPLFFRIFLVLMRILFNNLRPLKNIHLRRNP